MKHLNEAISVLGIFSFLSLIAFYLALHDIWHDYASPEVWARAGQPLPAWFDPVNSCRLEWGMMQVGFLIILAFHILLFVRMMKSKPAPKPTLDKAGNFEAS
jgi:hypothetical protein